MTANITRTARRCGLPFGASALMVAGFFLGQSSAPKPLAAQQPAPAPVAPQTQAAYSGSRPIATVYNNVPITREEFGNYLISLYADERLDLYVNKRIIEIAAAKANIDITPIEIEAAIDDDCKHMNISKDDFMRRVLKERYHKSPTEWRNDVMKPRLLLAKMCRSRITVDDIELHHLFDNMYGEKAKCKIIMWPVDQKHIADKMYGELRKPGTLSNPDLSWDLVATKQPDANLAARAGEIEPIGHFSGSDSTKFEEIAFSLKVGEVSPIVELSSIGYMVLKRVGTVEPVKGMDFEKLKPDLTKEVINRKIAKEIPKFFSELRNEAHPVLFLGKQPLPSPESMIRGATTQ